MSQDLQDTNILISPQPRQPAPVAPAPVFQPAPIYQPAPVIQPIIQQAPVQQPIVYNQAPTPQQPIIVGQSPAPQQPVIIQSQPAPVQPIYVTQESTSSPSSSHTYKSGKSTTTAKVHQVTTTKEKHTASKTKSTHKVNWGGVVKGVAVVGAVALVGVGLYAGGVAVTEWALASPAVSGVVGSIAEFCAPAVTWLQGAGAWLEGFIPQIPSMIANFFSSAAGALGLGSAAASVPAGTAVAVGTVAAGAGVAGASSHLLPSLDHVSFASHGTAMVPGTNEVHVTSTVTTDPVVTHHAKASSTDAVDLALDANATTDMSNYNLANTHAAHASQAHTAHEMQHAAELGHHSMHLSHVKMKHAIANSATSDVQADANDHASSNEASAPDVDIEDADVAKFSQRQPRSGWRSLLSGGKKTTESHASSVSKRDSEFASALDADRAKLDALTAEAAR